MRFRIASFNVENLVLPDVRYYDRYPETREQYDTKVNWIAATLTRAKADIVGIQEVWFDEVLSDAVKRSVHFAGGANVIAPGASRLDNLTGDLAKRPRLGLISRFPIMSATTTVEFPASVDLTIPLRTNAGISHVPIAVPVFQRPVRLKPT